MIFNPIERDNIVFYDTEFSDLDPYKGELLSIGMVKPNGEELYIELQYDGEPSPWVQKNIIPMLKDQKISKADAATRIREFLGTNEPYAIAFVDNYDVIYLTKLFGAGNLPFKWMSVDFSSILFAMGVNPVKYQLDSTTAKQFYRDLGIKTKKYRHHHALDDARLLRDVWQKMLESSENS